MILICFAIVDLPLSPAPAIKNKQIPKNRNKTRIRQKSPEKEVGKNVGRKNGREIKRGKFLSLLLFLCCKWNTSPNGRIAATSLHRDPH
jgi:hypothetical protein